MLVSLDAETIAILCICILIAWVWAMRLVSEAAIAKGYGDIIRKLWFIGLFGLIVTPAIIVAALPDRSEDAPNTIVEDELPTI